MPTSINRKVGDISRLEGSRCLSHEDSFINQVLI